jgi:23S rRNA pseudouridine1911/1915/1917 synthase
MPEYTLKASSEDAGKRLDLLLIEFSQKRRLGFSRTLIQKLIASGNITLNNINSIKPHRKVKTNDEIKVNIEEKKDSTIKPEEIALDVVYEDDDLAVINKPSGLVVHPAPGNYTHTLANALLARFKNLSNINPQTPSPGSLPNTALSANTWP